jgi:hypothetical protein
MFHPFYKKTVDEEGRHPADTLDHLAGRHKGKKKFCAPGTDGVEFPSPVLDLVSKFSSITVTKHWYSRLPANEPTQLVVGVWIWGLPIVLRRSDGK